MKRHEHLVECKTERKKMYQGHRNIGRQLTAAQVDHLRAVIRDVSKMHLWDCAMRLVLRNSNYTHNGDK